MDSFHLSLILSMVSLTVTTKKQYTYLYATFRLTIIFYLIYLFLAELSLLLGRLSPSCGEPGLFFTAVHRLLIAVASLAALYRL